jgi:tetratricopeptide (TPR) repeat protein
VHAPGRFVPRAALSVAAFATLALVVACSSRSTARVARTPPSESTAAPESAVQRLYESGRYGEVVSRVTAATPSEVGAEALWLAAHSNLRMGRTDEAANLFARLTTVGADPAWQVTSQLALAGLGADAEATDRARQAANSYAKDPFVQYELGLAHARSGDFAAAAEAFDRAIEANSRFAYAYYYAGLAYSKIDRADRMALRFETFLRLAPEAPERPEVESILRTLRGR